MLGGCLTPSGEGASLQTRRERGLADKLGSHCLSARSKAGLRLQARLPRVQLDQIENTLTFVLEGPLGLLLGEEVAGLHLTRSK